MKYNLIHARPRLLISILMGLIIPIFFSQIQIFINLSILEKILVAYNIFQWSYLLSLLGVIFTSHYMRIKEQALREDESANFVLSIASISSLVSLITIALELSSARDVHGISKTIHLALPAITLIGAWSLLPIMFAIHYAHLFYLTNDVKKKPLVFPDNPENPDYFDFLYFSMNIAVASQTADINVNSKRARRLVLAQCILAFLFNTSLLALGINVAASLLQ